MKVIDVCDCRLGNALFRYMASSLFCIIYKGTRTYDINECNMHVTENFYKLWSNSILKEKQVLNIDTNANYIFNNFYQTDL